MIDTITEDELDELGIDVRRSEFVEAYRTDEDTITVLVGDETGGSHLDPPNEDWSGENAWEWIAFDDGQERDEYIGRMCDPDDGTPAYRQGFDFWIERYEHSLVRYAPTGEASQVDRQWDVAGGVAIMRFRDDHGCGANGDTLGFVRGICEEYTSWSNGDCYGIVTFERSKPDPVPFMEPDDFSDVWTEGDSVWGFLGYEYAQEAAKSGGVLMPTNPTATLSIATNQARKAEMLRAERIKDLLAEYKRWERKRRAINRYEYAFRIPVDPDQWYQSDDWAVDLLGRFAEAATCLA